MTETLDQLMARLRAEYLEEVPERLHEMRRARARWLAGFPPEGPPLLTLFHRLAGSAGAYGYGDVSAACREAEQWLATGPEPSEEAGRRLARAIDAIEQAFDRPPSTEGIEG